MGVNVGVGVDVGVTVTSEAWNGEPAFAKASAGTPVYRGRSRKLPDEARQHRGHATRELQFRGVVLPRDQRQTVHEFDDGGDLAAFATRFGEALALMAGGDAIGAFPDQNRNGGGRTEKVVGETAVPAGNPAGQAVGGLGEVERGVIDVEPVMGEVVHEITSGFMGRGRLDRPLARSGRAVKPPPMNGK